MKNNDISRVAVRTVGCSALEQVGLQALLDALPAGPGRFGVLRPDNLRDPDCYFFNADHPDARFMLTRLRPGPLRPALMVGNSDLDSGFPLLKEPIDAQALQQALDLLMHQRALALAQLPASGHIPVPERRRRRQHGMRDRGAPVPLQATPLNLPSTADSALNFAGSRSVLLVDEARELEQALRPLLALQNATLHRTTTTSAALILCATQQIDLVLLRMPLLATDPYRLCADIRGIGPAAPVVVVLLDDQAAFEAESGRLAGCAGFLDAPWTMLQLTSLLRKCLPAAI